MKVPRFGGFSLILLYRKMNNKEIPIYNAIVALDDDNGMVAISLVDRPAIERNFVAFNQDKEPQKFATNPTEHKITGVAIIADMPIYRCDPIRGEYYIVFNKETIQNIVEKYSQMGFNNVVNLQHDENAFVDDVVMVEYFIKNTEKGINPTGFEDVADGSLFVTYKINNNEVWEEITNGDSLKGFSIEVFCDLGKADFEKEPTIDEYVESLLGDVLKKKFRAVSRGDVRSAMEEQKQVVFEYEGKTYQVQIHSLGKSGANDIVNVYNPTSDKWETYLLDRMRNLVITPEPIENWNYEAPTYKEYINNDNITTTETAVSSSNEIERAMNGNHYVIINYDDEQENPSTGSRRIFIGHWGYTIKGNEAICAYEFEGDSRSGLDGGGRGDWRLFLTRRIKDFGIVEFMKPVSIAPVGFNNSMVIGNMSRVIKKANIN